MWSTNKAKLTIGIVGGFLALIISSMTIYSGIAGNIRRANEDAIRIHELASEPRMQVLESQVKDMRVEQKEQRVILNEILREVKKDK
jgi:hypothetical protein